MRSTLTQCSNRFNDLSLRWRRRWRRWRLHRRGIDDSGGDIVHSCAHRTHVCCFIIMIMALAHTYLNYSLNTMFSSDNDPWSDWYISIINKYINLYYNTIYTIWQTTDLLSNVPAKTKNIFAKTLCLGLAIVYTHLTKRNGATACADFVLTHGVEHISSGIVRVYQYALNNCKCTCTQHRVPQQRDGIS